MDTENATVIYQEKRNLEPRKATFTTGLVLNGVNNKTVLKWQQLAGNAETVLKKLLSEENHVLEKNIQLEVEKWLVLKQEISIGLGGCFSLTDMNGSDGEHSSDWETLNEHTDSGAELEDIDNDLEVKGSRFVDQLKLLQAKLFVKTNCLINETLSSEFKTSKILDVDPCISTHIDSGVQSMADSLKIKEISQCDSDHFSTSSKCKLKVRKKKNSKRWDKRRRRNQNNVDRISSEENLLQDIRVMRNEKNVLVDQRSDLDDDRVSAKAWTAEEEAEFIYLDETIDIIDTLIELKNCSLLGHNYFQIGGNKTEKILLNKLERLKEEETLFLLSKYISKTLALRQVGFKLDQRMNKLEGKHDKQNWEIRKIKAHIKQEKENLDKDLELLKKHYLGKVEELVRVDEDTNANVEKFEDSTEGRPSESPAVKVKGRKTKVIRLKRKVIIEQQTSD